MVIPEKTISRNALIGGSISVLYRQAAAFLSAELKPYKLGAGQHACLLLIADNDGLRQEDLSRILHTDKAHIARAVKKLIDLGYIQRTVHPNDQRARKLFARTAGHEVIPHIHRAIQKWNQKILQGFSEADQQNLAELLKKAAENACR